MNVSRVTMPPRHGSDRLSRRPRVLYADDEEDVREVFAAVFENDFDVTCVRGLLWGERERNSEATGSLELDFGDETIQGAFSAHLYCSFDPNHVDPACVP